MFCWVKHPEYKKRLCLKVKISVSWSEFQHEIFDFATVSYVLGWEWKFGLYIRCKKYTSDLESGIILKSNFCEYNIESTVFFLGI